MFLHFLRRPSVWAAFFIALPLAAQTQEELAQQSRHAKELMSAGQFEEAIPIYQQLVKAVPGNPGLILNLGLAEEMAGHPAQAAPHFEAVLKSQPNNVPALTSLGMARLQLNDPKRAVPPLQKLVTLQPDNSEGRGMLAGALMAVNRYEDAAAQYRKLAAQDPSEAKAWYGLGKAYESLSARSFDRLQKLGAQSPYVAALIADEQARNQQYRSAFFFYRQAAGKLPHLPGLHTGLADVYRKTGHDDWAGAEEKMERNLPSPNCTVAVAECQFTAGNFLKSAQAAGTSASAESLYWATKSYNQLALQAFEHLGRLPESVEIHALKAEVFHSHKQYAEAANEWRAALKLAPGDPRLEHELASSLFLAQDYRTAVPMIEKMLGENPKPPDLNFMMGDSLVRTQQPEKAVPYLKAALKGDPAMLAADASLGLALALVNKQSEAIPHLEKALSLDEDGSLHYQLARSYQSAGNTQRARELMAQYQQIQKQNEQSKQEVAKEAEITAPGGK